MKFLRQLPNTLTCLNLLCGCIGIVEAFHNNLFISCIMIGFAAVFDFFDGFAARLLKAYSSIGKDLDSLADMVTFGVLPSVILYQMAQAGIPDLDGLWKAYLVFVVAIFSAIRLAKFNNDPRQSDHFIGVPTPANAILIASLLLTGDQYPELVPFMHNPDYVVGFSVLMSYLLIAEFPLFSFKFKSFGWNGNEIRFLFIGLAIVLGFWLKLAAIPLTIVLYILVSLSLFAFGKSKL